MNTCGRCSKTWTHWSDYHKHFQIEHSISPEWKPMDPVKKAELVSRGEARFKNALISHSENCSCTICFNTKRSSLVTKTEQAVAFSLPDEEINYIDPRY